MHAVRRPVVLSFSFPVLVLSLSVSFSSAISGVVIDTSGRAIPRASIEVIGADGGAAGSVFSDADGSFRVASAPEGCRLRASLAGFEPAIVPCRSDAPVRLELAVAPVAEHIVVSATRTEAPSGQ